MNNTLSKYLTHLESFSLEKLNKLSVGFKKRLIGVRKIRREAQAEGRKDNLYNVEAELDLKLGKVTRLIDAKTPRKLTIYLKYPFSEKEANVVEEISVVYRKEYLAKFEEYAHKERATYCRNYADKSFSVSLSGTENYYYGELTPVNPNA
jgi:hypothetical protein